MSVLFERGGVKVAVALTINDILQALAIRSAVFMAEQACPYFEEFDGNDFAGATRLVAYRDGEPSGTIRFRWFADFAKAERLAVRKDRRNVHIAKAIIDAGAVLAARKGYRQVLGHIEPELLPFWKRYGAVKDLKGGNGVQFSDRSYVEVVKELDASIDALTINSPALVLLRPEGDWDRPGILDRSVRRSVQTTR
jgi:predicted GNAT family N-acyltransferase